MKTISKHVGLALGKACPLAKACHKIKVFVTLSALLAFFFFLKCELTIVLPDVF